MSKKSTILLALVVVSAVVYFATADKNEALDKELNTSIPVTTQTENKKIQTVNSAPVTVKEMIKQNENIIKEKSFVPQNEDEESAEVLQIFFKKYVSESLASQDLMDDLNRLELSPQRTVQTNDATGSLNIVRTNVSLPGTRYIHAQFFTDENGKEFLQHLSHDYRPGPDSFDRMKDLARQYLSGEILSETSKDGYSLIKMKNGYNVSVTRLETNPNDPFNAWDEEKDKGTIRIEVELEIHSDENSDHIHKD